MYSYTVYTTVVRKEEENLNKTGVRQMQKGTPVYLNSAPVSLSNVPVSLNSVLVCLFTVSSQK